MSQTTWTAVDEYISQTLVKPDQALDAAIKRINDAGMPAISVSPAQGKMLMLLARLCGAKKVLEIGTLGAYSTIWLARGISPGGKVITLEAEPKHAEVARKNMEAAGVAAAVELRLGKALDTLPQLEKAGPFDLIFVDADKDRLPDYFRWSVRLSRTGTLIVIDNVVRKGGVLDTSGKDASVAGVRKMNELIAAEKRVSATTIQTVGAKGYDGLTLAVVTG